MNQDRVGFRILPYPVYPCEFALDASTPTGPRPDASHRAGAPVNKDKQDEQDGKGDNPAKPYSRATEQNTV